MTDRTWVIVLAADDVRAAMADGFVRTSSGKRAVLARMNVGDRLVLYSPRESHPDGPALRAVTGTGEVTGDQPEEVPGQSEAHRRAAHRCRRRHLGLRQGSGGTSRAHEAEWPHVGSVASRAGAKIRRRRTAAGRAM